MNKENENAECQNLTGSRLKKGAANLSGCLLTDMMGRQVYNQSITGANGLKAINTSFLGNGIYYWKLTDIGGNYQTGRITILKLN